MTLTFKWKIWQSFIGEMTASFLFGFAVYGSSLSSTIKDVSFGPLIVGLTVGFSGIAIIYALSDITVAHFNPAITLSAILFLKLDVIKGIMYIIFQFLGFMLAAAVVLGCFPGKSSDLLDIIRPAKANEDVSNWNLILTEAILTGILTFIAFQVAINVYQKPKIIASKDEELLPKGEVDLDDIEDSGPDKTILAPLVIGLTLGFLAFIGFGSSGGVFNPGLVLPGVLYTGVWNLSWAYWVAEFVGGFIGAAIQVLIIARHY